MNKLKKVKKLFKEIRWIIVAFISSGVALILISETLLSYLELLQKSNLVQYIKIFANIGHHVGIALIIASIVGIIIEFTEMKGFFEDVILQLMKGDEFLSLLSEKKLKDFNNLVITRIIQNKVNNTYYDIHSLPHSITTNIFQYIGEIYREDYNETIEYKTLQENEIEQLKIDRQKIKKKIVRMTSNISFVLVSPKENESVEYELSFWGEAKKVPGLDKDSHYIVQFSVDGEEIPIKKDNYIQEKGYKVIIDLKQKIKFNTRTFIQIKNTWYDYGHTGFHSAIMKTLTYKINVHFSSLDPLSLEAEIFGIPGVIPRKIHSLSTTSNSVNLSFHDWMFPGDGYFINWEELG